MDGRTKRWIRIKAFAKEMGLAPSMASIKVQELTTDLVDAVIAKEPFAKEYAEDCLAGKAQAQHFKVGQPLRGAEIMAAIDFIKSVGSLVRAQELLNVISEIKGL